MSNKYKYGLIDRAKQKILTELLKLILKLIKWMLKFSLNTIKKILKSTIRELKKIKSIIKDKNQRYMLIACTFSSLMIIILAFNVKYSFLSIITYFIIKGIAIDIKEGVKDRKKSIKVKSLNKKYNHIRSLFDNNISIVNESYERITIYSKTVTRKELEGKIHQFELFFNRKIYSIMQKNGNFKVNDIVFFIDTKFKKYYKFQDYLPQVSNDKIKKMYLPFIAGIDQKENLLTLDLESVKFLFVAGESGGGKSVMVNTIIQSLMVFNNDIIYILIDLKEGVELSDYANFPNCLTCSNHLDLEKVITVIDKIMTERLQIISSTERCKDIKSYNKKDNTKNMNNIVIFVDEIAEIKLNGSKPNARTELEVMFLRILQKGRAAGIFCVAATQRPATDQIDGGIRAGFHKHISFCVTTKETQRMTKIYDTEQLKKGEFKTDLEGNQLKTWKGLLILDEEDKELPECNLVYDQLKHVMVDHKFLISPDEKLPKINTNFLHKLRTFVFKNYAQKLRPLFNYAQEIKTVKNEIINDIEHIKLTAGIQKNTIENTHKKMGHNYFNFLKFLIENFQENKNIPQAKDIEKACNISEKQRRNLLVKAREENYIIKKNATTHTINLDCKLWDEIREEEIRESE